LLLEKSMTETTLTTEQRGVPRWVQIIIWIFLVGLLVLVALGLQRAQKPMAEVGKRIPELSFQFFNGYEYRETSQMSLSDLRGQVVVINVWASWCKPCEQEAPELQKFWEAYQDREMVLIGVDYVDTPSGAMTYMKKFKITFPNAPDLQSAISSTLNRKMGVPETYFIDRDGVLKYVQVGPFTSMEEIQTIVDPLLNQ
jgi:cytochrome c biogenesis protein CcmG/thiol:disulfide interchange protein DsbE